MSPLFAKTNSTLKRKNYNKLLEIITCVPSVYKMDNLNFIVCSLMKNSIVLKGVNVVSFSTKDELRKLMKDEHARIDKETTLESLMYSAISL